MPEYVFLYDAETASFISHTVSPCINRDLERYGLFETMFLCSSKYTSTLERWQSVVKDFKILPVIPYLLIFVCYLSVISAPFIPQHYFDAYINTLFFGFIFSASLPVLHFIAVHACLIIGHIIAYQDLSTLLESENKSKYEYRGYELRVETTFKNVFMHKDSVIVVNKIPKYGTFMKTKVPQGFSDVNVYNYDNRVVLVL
jgi:hypothetical protein